MARGTVPFILTCLLRILLLLSDFNSCYAIAHPNPAIAPNHNCTINNHPDTSDLTNTTYTSHVRTTTLSTNRKYRYVHYHPNPSAQKPTILFIHGFPSTSFDWRRQFRYFASRGYGIVAPDLLGFGGTDKPSDPDAYTLKRQAAEVVGLLDCATGGGGKAVALTSIADDLYIGAPLLSRIATYYPDRFENYVFLDIGYMAPGQLYTEAKVKADQKVLGYQIFFIRDNSGYVVDKHQDSIFSLFYTNNDLKNWSTYLSPTGALEAFLEADRTVPTGAFVTAQDEAIHNSIFAAKRGGYNPSLNHYRAIYRNLNLADENAIPESAANLTKPVLLLTASNDPIGTPAAAESLTRPYAPDLRVQQITSGHFLMLEKANEVNKAMNDFLEG